MVEKFNVLICVSRVSNPIRESQNTFLSHLVIAYSSFKPYKGKSKLQDRAIEDAKREVSNPIRESQNKWLILLTILLKTCFKPYKGKSKSYAIHRHKARRKFQTL